MNKIKVTEVQLLIVDSSQTPNLKAYVRVTLNESILLTGMKLYDWGNHLTVHYPNDKESLVDKERKFFRPISISAEMEIEHAVVKKYLKEVKK